MSNYNPLENRDSIKEFLAKTELVLESQTVMFSIPIPKGQDDLLSFSEQLIVNGEFCRSAGSKIWDPTKGEPAIENFEWQPMKIDLHYFKEFLLDMLVLDGSHFHDLGTNLRIDLDYAKSLVDDLWVEFQTLYPKEKWSFYTMPRNYSHSTRLEQKYLFEKENDCYRPMGEFNIDNPLGKYFRRDGNNSFLIFGTSQRVYFLLTNGLC